MPENLLRATWTELDQADLRLVLKERIGEPGQYDGRSDVLYLPLARDKCRVSLKFKGAQIVAIEPRAAFDCAEWNRICAEIEGSILKGPQKVGREFSFNTFRVEGWWRGAQSGVQILPPPPDAPRAPAEIADHPFILEFPLQEASLWSVTNHRRIREHHRLTLLLNLLLLGTTKFLPDRQRHYWANVRPEAESGIEWVQEFYFAKLGEAVTSEFSTPTGDKLEEVASDEYYTVVGHDGLGLRVPDDLDESICRYQNLSSPLRAKFDRATYWMSMASRQWEDSMSASFASLVSSAEALTDKTIKHNVYCDKCNKEIPHDVPGATENFRAFFEQYAPDPGLRKRRNKMYAIRSKISHGSELLQIDLNRAFGWDPPGWNERELHLELWSLLRAAARNWLMKNSTDEIQPIPPHPWGIE
jgi:Apea-like HEPN